MTVLRNLRLALLAFLAIGMAASTPAVAQKKPNVVMLMTDDTGWMISVPIREAAQPLAIRPQISTGSRRKERCSRVGTAKRVAQQAAPPS
jgi:hypothetical protein